MRLRGIILCGGAVFAFGVSARAVPPAQNEAFARWRVQDRCVADSVTAHPDRTIESLQARDLFVDKCLADHNLPPRAHLAPHPADAPAPAAPPPQSDQPR